jgi:hypothetical protein
MSITGIVKLTTVKSISSAFSITKPNVEIYTGDINKTWKCSELKIMAGNGEFDADVCLIVLFILQFRRKYEWLK